MSWVVAGAPELGEFETEGEAVAAAWQVTAPGQKRPDVRASRNDDWLDEASEMAGVQMTPVKGTMESSAHGARPVLRTTFRAPRALAEMIVTGVEDVHDKRRAWYDWIIRNVTPKLRAESPYLIHDYEYLSVGIENFLFDGATFVAEVEAVIIPIPTMRAGEDY